MSVTTKIRRYNPDDCVVFRITTNRWGGLSNMASHYPICVNGTPIWSSEALYQACRFPNAPEAQRLIIAERNPMVAKMKAKHFKARSRSDWDVVRVKVMRWCIRVKLANNWEKFGLLLSSTDHRPIVEESRRDAFWGAKPSPDGKELIGVNALGRLLMQLRDEFQSVKRDRLRSVSPPDISDFLIFGDPVRLVESSDKPVVEAPARVAFVASGS